LPAEQNPRLFGKERNYPYTEIRKEKTRTEL